MTDNYYIIPLQIEEDYIWCVMETQTEQLIKAFEFQEEAEEYSFFLENGGAFDGFTPSFILREVAPKQSVDQEFSALVG